MNAASSQSSQGGLTPPQHEAVECALTRSHASRKRVDQNAIVLKRGGTFMICDPRGDIVPDREAGLGLFREDTRFLSLYELTLNGRLPVFLSTEQHVGESTVHDLENDDLPGLDSGTDIPAHTLAVQRERRAGERDVRDTLRITYFGMQQVKVRLSLRFAADFADLMAIRGMGKRTPGRTLESEVAAGHAAVRLRFLGDDGCARFTQLAFSRAATELDGGYAHFDLQLNPGQTEEITTVIRPGEGSEACDDSATGFPEAPGGTSLITQAAEVTGHSLVANIVRRGLLDLELLRTPHPDGSHYIAGGVPWYVTLFGRDSVWSALEICALQSAIAGQTVRLLAKYQANELDAYHAAQPGKILHELRQGELARLGLIPQSPVYYGSVDSTPLFLILLSEYVVWTGDLGTARELYSHIERALEWIDRYGDSDGDGYLDYGGRYPRGLVNQGWKDSGDAIVNEDGTLANPPIALAEVQGYLFRAWRSTARLLERLDHRDSAAELERKAAALRERFGRDFWSQDLGCYVLALQQGGRPVKVVASNAGQVLWSGLPSAEHAAATAQRLMQDDMFSGWGVRTLSSKTVRYNPLSYHLGSVWPHDNSVILCGLRRYGLNDAAIRIFNALIAAARGFPDQRMPELYCGLERRPHDLHPTRYPVACSPQAWAAGALPYTLTNLLGFEPDALEKRLAIRDPCLPEWLERVTIRQMRVGSAKLDITFTRRDGRVDFDVEMHAGELRVERLGSTDANPGLPPVGEGGVGGRGTNQHRGGGASE